MKRWTTCRQVVLVLLLSSAFALLGALPAAAESEDSWSIVLTPQIWGTHVAKNGFVAGAPNTVYYNARDGAGSGLDAGHDGGR
jgi:hypothetical protein